MYKIIAHALPKYIKQNPQNVWDPPKKLQHNYKCQHFVMPRMYEHVAPVVLIANPWQVEADCLICAIRSYNQQQSNHTYHVLHNQNQDRHRCLHCQCNQLQQPRRRLWQLSSASGKEKWLSKLWQEQKWIIFFFCILSWLKFELLAQIPTFAEFLRLPISKRTENTNANYKTDKWPTASIYVYM